MLDKYRDEGKENTLQKQIFAQGNTKDATSRKMTSIVVFLFPSCILFFRSNWERRNTSETDFFFFFSSSPSFQLELKEEGKQIGCLEIYFDIEDKSLRRRKLRRKQKQRRRRRQRRHRQRHRDQAWGEQHYEPLLLPLLPPSSHPHPLMNDDSRHVHLVPPWWGRYSQTLKRYNVGQGGSQLVGLGFVFLLSFHLFLFFFFFIIFLLIWKKRFLQLLVYLRPFNEYSSYWYNFLGASAVMISSQRDDVYFHWDIWE